MDRQSEFSLFVYFILSIHKHKAHTFLMRARARESVYNCFEFLRIYEYRTVHINITTQTDADTLSVASTGDDWWVMTDDSHKFLNNIHWVERLNSIRIIDSRHCRSLSLLLL